jgi:hypothetical protein
MQSADYPGYNRRHFLKHLAGYSLMALPGLHFVQRLRAAASTLKKENKSIIILWMSGGPSHLDIWDLKPGESTAGEFMPTKTAVSGIDICQHMPQVAKQMKHLSVIRSLVTNEGSHERGRQLMHTSRMPNPSLNFPSLGAVASFQLTAKDLALPGFIAVGRPADGPGFLGMNYAPFTVQNPGQPPENIRPPDSLGDDLRIQRRRQLFYAVEENFGNNLIPQAPKDEKRADAAQAHTDIYKKAFSLVASKEGKVFDISKEKTSLIEEYCGTGQMANNNGFGKGCLLARRLVEAGVTCVEVDLGGWDNHAGIFPTLKNQRLPVLDKAMAALVRDLNDRGMWQKTVLVWMGEFGRTPRINQNAGRDHWARCWSVVLGGGSLKGGLLHGSTSKDGTDVKDNPCSVGDVFATLYKGLGIDPTMQIRDAIGRPHNIAEGKPIEALF